MASLPDLVHYVRVDRSVFFREETEYIFQDDTGLADNCHHETGNHWVNVGCCGGSGSRNCGENSRVVLDVLIRSIDSTEFYADWTTSSSSRINTTNLRTACDQARVARWL